MSPLMREVLAQKQARRARLAALPYPEKVRIVAQLRDAALRIKASAQGRISTRIVAGPTRPKPSPSDSGSTS